MLGAMFGGMIGWLLAKPRDAGDRAENNVLVYGMMDALPNVGDPFPDHRRDRWVDTFVQVLGVVWPPSEPEKKAPAPKVPAKKKE